MKPFLFCLCYVVFFCAHSQNYQLIDTTDYDKRKLLISELEKENEIFNKQLKSSYKGRVRKEVLGFYEASQEHFIEIINNKKLLFDHKFQNYIDSLYILLKDNNPLLAEGHDIQLLLSKDPSPNALSLGNGMIVVNIGLFTFLENEHQILSVIAHEISHDLLKHTHESIESRANVNTSLVKHSFSTRGEKYNRGTRSFNLLKALLYEDGQKRRQHEIQADSMGYVLFKNSNSPKSQFIRALKVLKKYDSVPSITLDHSIYKKVFDLPNQPFKTSWIKNEDFNGYNYEFYKSKIDLDSLKDHPELDERIAKLEDTFPELIEENWPNPINTPSFLELKETANQAYVENLHYLNEYGLSIYLILNRLEKDLNDPYYRKWLGINFEALYNAKKGYKVNRYVDRVVPNEQSESYQQFLNFIWNLNLNEIKAIADYYNAP